MKRYILAILMTVVTFGLWTGCKEEEPRREKEGKTILIYMAADNNLRANAVINLEDLEMGYIPEKNDKNKLLVFLDAGDLTSKLVRFYKDGKGGVIKEIIEAYPDRNSASPEVLGEITSRVVTLFPSDSYGLILWSHGTGWVPSRYYSDHFQMKPMFVDPYAHLVKSFGADYDEAREINIDEMQDVLPVKYKFIIFDCCLMGGVETIYELRDRADFIIASPTETLAAGLPYALIMEPLFQSEDGLKKVCDTYFNIYNEKADDDIMKSATISLYKTAELVNLAPVVREIIETNREKVDGVNLDDMQRYFRYDDRWYYDFGYFIKTLASKEQYRRFEEIYQKVVIYDLHTPSFLQRIFFDEAKTTGLSGYVPKAGDSELDFYYRTLDWNRDVQLVKDPADKN